MKITKISILCLAVILSACGSKEEKKTEPTQKTMPRLSQEQKRDFLMTVMSEMRASKAISAQFETQKNLNRIQSTLLSSSLGLLQNQDEDPQLNKMISLLKANCVTEKKESNAPGFKHVEGNLSGAACAVNAFGSVDINSPNQNQVQGNATWKQLVLSDEYRSLNDITDMNFNLDASGSVAGDEKSLTAEGRLSQRGSMFSQTYGSMTVNTDGALSLAVKNKELVDINGSIVHTLSFPSFTGELRVAVVKEGQNIVMKLWINGEPVENGNGLRFTVSANQQAEIINALTLR